jgi:hypothetical protein
MRDEIVIPSTVGTIAAPSAVGDLDPYVFQIGTMHFFQNQIPHVAASGITGAEEVNLWKLTAGTWVKVYDGSGNEVKLTLTNPQEAILSPGVYGFSKTSGTGITVTIQMP